MCGSSAGDDSGGQLVPTCVAAVAGGARSLDTLLTMNAAIDTQRSSLVPMSAAFLEASLAGDRDAARAALGADLPEEWPDHAALLRLRLRQLRETPSLEPWLLRAIVLREQVRMIGHVGFHGPPGAGYLAAYAPGGVELGYTVFGAARGRGYATEAAAGLIDWAHARHGVTRFVLSIRPDNAASLAIARKLGFHRIGEQVDEEEGLEHVFLKELPKEVRRASA